MIARILVPMDFSQCSDEALDYALSLADQHGAEVEILYVWPVENGLFAETPQGIAMEQRLSAAESEHPTRVCGRLEFGDEPADVILEILEHEPFDLVVLGREPEKELGHVATNIKEDAPCAVVTIPPPDEEAA